MRTQRVIVPSLRGTNAAYGIGQGVVPYSVTTWALDWGTYGRPSTSYTLPGSFTKTWTTATQVLNGLQSGGGLVDGDVVHIVGPMTINGTVGGHQYITQRLTGSGADIYVDSNVTWAGDSSTLLDNSVFHSVNVYCQNIRMYGGVIAGGRRQGLAIGPFSAGHTADCIGFRWWGLKIHNQGTGGVYSGGLQANDGNWYGCTGNDIDVEIWDTGQLAASLDVHTVKGTGIHAAYLGGSPSSSDVITPSTKFLEDGGVWSIYAHDISQSFGDCQLGDSCGPSQFYIRAGNLTGDFSTSGSLGYNASPAITPFDNFGQNICKAHIVTVEVDPTPGNGIVGAVVMCTDLGTSTSNVLVDHGRGHGQSLQSANAASYFGGRNGTYDHISGTPITYTDCSS